MSAWRWLLCALLTTPPASGEPGEPSPAPIARRAEPTLTLAVAGDVMFGRVTPKGYRPHGGLDPFGRWRATLLAADLAFVNLETGICREGRRAGPFPLLWAPPERLDTLRAAGVDVVSVANNHTLDCGADGLTETVTELERRGLHVAGVAPTGTVHVSDEISFVAATLHPPPYPSRGARPLSLREGAHLIPHLHALRRAHPARLLVVSLHWGRERAEHPAAWQRHLGRALVAAGANAVVGHGSHTRQPLEQAGDGVILYGLGNLVFDDAPASRRPHPPVLLHFLRGERGFTFVAASGPLPPGAAPN